MCTRLTAPLRHDLQTPHVWRQQWRLAAELTSRQRLVRLRSSGPPPHTEQQGSRRRSTHVLCVFCRCCLTLRLNCQLRSVEAAAAQVDGRRPRYAPKRSDTQRRRRHTVGEARRMASRRRVVTAAAALVPGCRRLLRGKQEAVEPHHSDGVRQSRQYRVTCMQPSPLPMACAASMSLSWTPKPNAELPRNTLGTRGQGTCGTCSHGVFERSAAGDAAPSTTQDICAWVEPGKVCALQRR